MTELMILMRNYQRALDKFNKANDRHSKYFYGEKANKIKDNHTEALKALNDLRFEIRKQIG